MVRLNFWRPVPSLIKLSYPKGTDGHKLKKEIRKLYFFISIIMLSDRLICLITIVIIHNKTIRCLYFVNKYTTQMLFLHIYNEINT